jgi:hydrogenase maturation protein HypF
LAGNSLTRDAYPFPFVDGRLDFRPLLDSIIQDRLRGRNTKEIARAFHRGVALGLRNAVTPLCSAHAIDTVVLSGGVFQNELMLRDLKELLEAEQLQIWTNHAVPANDGGISFGQAALAALAGSDCSRKNSVFPVADSVSTNGPLARAQPASLPDSEPSLKDTSAASAKKPGPKLIHA